MGRRGDYLYQRVGSSNWYLRLVNPPELAAELGRARTEVSLGTSNRVEAEALAAQHIARHKMALLAIERQRAGKPMPLPGTAHHRYPPNTSVYIDGVRVVATDDTLLFFNAADDTFLRSEPNRIEVSLTNAIDLAMAHPGYLRPHSAILMNRAVRAIRPTASGGTYMMRKTDRILENWIERRHIGKHVEAEAREAWRIFHWLSDHRPLPQCNRADALKLIRHLQGENNKSKTIEKKVSHLRAAVQLAIDDGIFSGVNPFSRVMERVGFDSEKRLPLSAADMEKARENLGELSREDQLLWIMLATTGMRLSEPFGVREEFESDQTERIRFIIVGTKTEASERRVPLPPEVKRRLQARITAPIFSNSPETHGKRLRRFLQRLEISFDPKRGTGDPRKTVHSLRHRAADRLREAECPDSLRYALLGHELISVAEGYGSGYSVSSMRRWQEKIGF